MLRQYFEDDDLWWFLPAAGAVCGYITNFLALWLIFKPSNGRIALAHQLMPLASSPRPPVDATRLFR